MFAEIQKKVVELISQQTGLKKEDVSLQSSFEDLNMDSVGLVEIVFSIEEYFEINIPLEEIQGEEQLEKFANVETLIKEIQKIVEGNK